MLFLDNNAHIFEIYSYSEIPVGYEYETTPYIFWLDDDYSNSLSINNYYTIPIRILTDKNIVNISVKLESDIYKFSKINNISDNLIINESNLVNELNDINEFNRIDNIQVINENGIYSSDNYKLLTFYVFGNSSIEGTILSNILISVNYDDGTEEYCPVTIGGTFINEIEQLKINARNIGVQLPKDIIKAVYQESYFNDVFDENLYNIKLKEYLLNHMLIKGECGNYNSAIASLKWFGWGEHIELSKLLKTDNEFAEQFIHDYFDINNDLLESFKKFKNSTYIVLTAYSNKESGKVEIVDDSKSLWGEGKPILTDLFKATTEVTYNDTEELNKVYFVKNYYDYTMREMMYKLSCLAYMYKKYFLPIHLNILSHSVQEKVFANDIKLLNKAKTNITEKPLLIGDTYNMNNYAIVTFDNRYKYVLYNQTLYTDNNYNVFNYYTKDFCENSDNTYYELDNQLTAFIPIFFTNKLNDNNVVYNCVLLLSRNNKKIHESQFSFVQNSSLTYNGLTITPSLFNNDVNADFWEDSVFRIDILCNGLWYSKEFILTTPEFNLEFNKLEYTYDPIYHKQLTDIKNVNEPNFERRHINFNAVMYDPGLVTMSNARFDIEIDNILSNMIFGEFNSSYNNDYSIGSDISLFDKYIELTKQYVKINDHKKYLNKIHIYELTDQYGNDVLYKETIPFGSITTEYNFNMETVLLYLQFFNNKGKQYIDPYIVSEDKDFPYDIYLMHDNKKYYVVFISRKTINNTNETIKINDTILFNDFILRRYKSDDVFLINRMRLINSNNIYHFDKDDIVSAKISNIDNLPFIMSLGSKWEFKKISLGGDTIPSVKSNTNTAIISVDQNHLRYISGYYDVTVNYSIDDFYQHNRTLHAKILINN